MLSYKAFILAALSIALTSDNVASQNVQLTPINSHGGPHTFTVRTNNGPATAEQAALQESFKRVSQEAQQFSFDLMSKFSDNFQAALEQTGKRQDFMISPFTIWSLLLLLVEGAAGETLRQLRTALHIDTDQLTLRKAFREVQSFLSLNTSTVEVASLQALFTDINRPVQRDYENIIERDYNSKLISVDFHDPFTAYKVINDEVHKATRGLIPYAIVPQDIKDARLFMLSSLYFKGQWKTPFNKSFTRSEPFFDENGTMIGNVDMMFQDIHANYVGINELEGHVLELPYGKEDRLSMYIILPRRGVTLNKLYQNLRRLRISTILRELNNRAMMPGFDETTVEIYLPRFSTTSDFSLNGVLEQLGILDVFSEDANLSKMSSDVFVANIIHSTKIVVNEEGTTAAAITAGIFANKATPPKFYLNRPFAYLIIEKKTNLLLFVGQVTNPNNV